MAFRKIKPHSGRAKVQITQIGDKFSNAAEAIKLYGNVSPAEFGIDWNSCSLKRVRKSGIEFILRGHNGCSDKILNGFVKNDGANKYLVRVNKDITGEAFSDNYIISSLYESIDIASKLEIIDQEILPGGEVIPAPRKRGEDRDQPPVIEPDINNYRAFAAELIDKSRGIIVSKINEDFGDYVVIKGKPGWFIAYNTGYGEAPYIVDNFDTLLKDKQSLKRTGEAIWFRRDPRGKWKDRIREYM